MPEVQVELTADSGIVGIPTADLTAAAHTAVQVAIEDRQFELPPGVAERDLLQISVRLTNDDGIQKLNRQYRGVDRPTDVLSFSFVAEQVGPTMTLPRDWPLQLGEIVLSLPYATRQALDLGHSVPTELAWLTVHATLQLLGYGHDDDRSAEHMEGLERQALLNLGINLE